jgi:hypothetical protein
LNAASDQALDYRAFLESKVKLDHACGFYVDPSELNPALKDHLLARWRLVLRAGGGAARDPLAVRS